MAKNSAVNLDITPNADGFEIAGGTTKRAFSVTGADVDIVGSGTNVYTFPVASDTLVGRNSTDTLTNKTLTSAILTTSTISGTTVLSGSIIPSINNVYNIGNTSFQIDGIFSKNLTIDTDLFVTSANNNTVSINNANSVSDLYVHTTNISSTPRGLVIDQYSANANSAMLYMRKGRGAFSSPTSVANADQIASIEMQAFGTQFGTRAKISAIVNGTVTSDNVPTDLAFYVTATTGASITERMRIYSTGNISLAGRLFVDSVNGRVGIHNTNPTYDFDVTGQARITNGLIVDATTFVVDAVNNRVGIGTASPTTGLEVTLASNFTQPLTTTSTITQTHSTLTTGTATSIITDALTTGTALLISSNSSDVSARNLVSIVQDHASASGAKALSIQQDGANNALFLDHNLAGSTIEIDADDNSANAMYGLTMAIDNAGAGLEYAFRFNGSEIVSSAVGGSQDKKIRVSIAGTDYFVPLHTA